jgi:hypothetical protein
MSEEEYAEIGVEQLELMAQACCKRKGQRRKTKLKAFDSITYELEKYKLKEKEPDQAEGASEAQGENWKEAQNCA